MHRILWLLLLTGCAGTVPAPVIEYRPQPVDAGLFDVPALPPVPEIGPALCLPEAKAACQRAADYSLDLQAAAALYRGRLQEIRKLVPLYGE